MGQVGRDCSGVSGTVSLLQQTHFRAQDTGLCPDSSGISPVRETQHPLQTICSGLGHCTIPVLHRVQAEPSKCQKLMVMLFNSGQKKPLDLRCFRISTSGADKLGNVRLVRHLAGKSSETFPKTTGPKIM